MGPKTPPMLAVPRLCTQTSAIRMTTVSGTMAGVSRLVATPRPSTALRTEMAGVMTPSP